MDKLFDVLFLEEAFEFLSNINNKHYEKILFNIETAPKSLFLPQKHENTK